MKADAWPTCTLGELLTPNASVIEIDPLRCYQQVTIRLWGRGVVPRGEIMGTEIGGTNRTRVRAGQFIVSKIDARNGAFGIVPHELDGAVASNDFPSFDVQVDRLRPGFLGWLSKTQDFVTLCKRASEGTTNRVRLSQARLLALEIRLPEPEEQDRITAKLNVAAAHISEAQSLCCGIDEESEAMLRSAFHRITAGTAMRPISEVAPLIRRAVDVKMGGEYHELGIRSFGKGTFHKPSLDFIAVGEKKLYHIEPGDLLFNNVFAWEGAIAVAQPEDEGRVGSHRFITCVADSELTSAEFLCFYFLTTEGLAKIGEASPGGAGRNRTLGLDKLMAIEVPIPPIERQRWFNRLQQKARQARAATTEILAESELTMPAILDKAFKGEL